jgi:hypothetical protein
MARRYAERTTVPIDRTQAEIRTMLEARGIDEFMVGMSNERAMIGFRTNTRLVRIDLPMPSDDDDAIRLTASGSTRPMADRSKARAQEIRRRWRALALVIKAKLEAIDSGISTFEDEFLSATVIPGGETLGRWAARQLDAAYQSQRMPSLLPGGDDDA